MPVQNLVATGVLMTVMLVVTASPDVATQFSHITDATVVLMVLPYIYSVVAMWRLNRSIDISAGKVQLYVFIGVLACVYCLSVVLGQSADLDRKALIVLLATTPFFALINRKR